MTNGHLLSVGEAAKQLRTTTRTLRYYEARGIVRPTTVGANGRRFYDPDTLQSVQRVLRLRSLGLPIESIHAILTTRDPTALRRAVAEHEELISKQLHELTKVHDRLLALLGRIDGNPQLSPRTTQDALIVLEDIAMLRIDQVYTRSGDDGTTSLADGTRTNKDDPALEAGGDIDELVCALGFALSLDAQHREELREIQNQLFDLTVTEQSTIDGFIATMERQCDAISQSLEVLDSWVLPGGDPYPGALHQARAICRRAERRCWTSQESLAARYLNRLSDLLFVLARQAAGAGAGAGEATWVPATSRNER